jgi:tetratricopeptide (TPR) repeat protein
MTNVWQEQTAVGQRVSVTLRLFLFAAFCCAALLQGCAGNAPPATVRVIDGQSQASPFVSPSAYEYYLQGELAFLRSDLSEAKQQFLLALSFDADAPYLHTRLAELYWSQGDRVRAWDQLRHALRQNSDFPDALMLAGRLYWQAGQVAQAETSFRRCMAANPEVAQGYLDFAELLERDGRAREAEQVLQTLLRRAKGHFEGNSRLALLCLRKLDYECTARQLELALQSRTDLPTVLRLATVHRARGHLAEAVRYLREAFDGSGGDLGVAALLVELLNQSDRQQEARDLLEVLWNTPPESEEGRSALAELFLEAQQPRRAEELVQVSEGGRDSARQKVIRARALAAQGKRAEAELLLRTANDAGQDVTLALGLAQLLGQEGDDSGASTILRQALTAHGPEVPLLLALSQSFSRQGKPSAAIQVLREALLADPQQQALRFGLGVALEKAGQWSAAIRTMESILRQNPSDAAAHNFIGYTQVIHGGDLKAAEQHIRRALFLQPAEGSILDSLGWLYYRRGNLAEAQRLLQLAVRLSPGEAEVIFHLAEVRAAQRELIQAQSLLRQAISHSDDSEMTRKLKARLHELEKGSTVKQ